MFWGHLRRQRHPGPGGQGRHPSPQLPGRPRLPENRPGRLGGPGRADGREEAAARGRRAVQVGPDLHDRAGSARSPRSRAPWCSAGGESRDLRASASPDPASYGPDGLRRPRGPNPRARCRRLLPSPTGRSWRRLRGGVGIKGLRSPRRDESATGPELRAAGVLAELQRPRVLAPPGIQNLHSRAGSRPRSSASAPFTPPYPTPRAAVPTDGAALGFAG